MSTEPTAPAPVVPCSTCGGTPHPSGLPCVCGGVGTQDAEVQGLRKALFDAHAKLGMYPSAAPADEWRPGPPVRPMASHDYAWPHHPKCAYGLSWGQQWCNCHQPAAAPFQPMEERVSTHEAERAHALLDRFKHFHGFGVSRQAPSGHGNDLVSRIQWALTDAEAALKIERERAGQMPIGGSGEGVATLVWRWRADAPEIERTDPHGAAMLREMADEVAQAIPARIVAAAALRPDGPAQCGNPFPHSD